MLFVSLSIFLGALFVNSIPPLMPVFQQQLNLSISFSSLIPIFNTLGTTVFSFLISFFINKLGFKKTNFISYGFIISALLLFSFSKTLPLLLLGAFFLGAGVSIIFTSSTTLLAHLENPKFGVMHGFFGLGGILSPMFVSIIIRSGLSYRYLFIFYLFSLSLLITWNLFMKFPAILESENEKPSRVYLKPMFIFTVLSLLLYAASEIGTVTWAPNLFISFGLNKEKAAIVLSVFWLLFTIARFLMDFLLKFINEKTYIKMTIICSLTFLLLTILLKNSVFFFFFGLSMGAIFPLIQRRANLSLSKSEVGFLNGITYSSTGIGSLLFISIMGYISNFSMRAMFLIPIIGLFLVFWLQIRLDKK